MRRFWLLFAQTVTVGLAVWFIVITLKPEWIGNVGNSIRHIGGNSSDLSFQEAPSSSNPGQGSYRNAAKRAMPR